MLTAYRRHLKSCPHKHQGRKYRRCECPVYVDGMLNGEEIRQSLDTRNWTKGQTLIREWELLGQAPGQQKLESEPLTIAKVCGEFEAEAVAQQLSPATIKKYRTLFSQLINFCERQGLIHFERIDLATLRAFRQSWADHNYSAWKKLERLQTVYRFAVESEYVSRNLAKLLAKPKITDPPTMPFTKEQMVSILFACETHQQDGQRRSKHDRRIRPLVLLLRYSGLRIGDAVCMKKSTLAGDRLLLHMQKTGVPVHLKLPQVVVDALTSMPSKSEEYFFWTGIGKPATATGNYRRNLRAVFQLAKIPDGHPHRFRDTFATELLLSGASLEEVSKLLGHRSIRITERHYAPWVRERQARLDANVERSWAADPILEAEAKGTPEVHGRKERPQ